MSASHASGWGARDALRGLPRLLGRLALAASSTRVLVEGDSMAPALANGDRVLVSRLVYRFAAPRRGDIVLIRDPARPGFECIKRVLALPGETIRLQGLHADLIRDGEANWSQTGPAWTLDQDEYFVVGDNLAQSTDSRSYGPVGRSSLLGQAWYRYVSATGATGMLEHPQP